MAPDGAKALGGPVPAASGRLAPITVPPTAAVAARAPVPGVNPVQDPVEGCAVADVTLLFPTTRSAKVRSRVGRIRWMSDYD